MTDLHACMSSEKYQRVSQHWKDKEVCLDHQKSMDEFDSLEQQDQDENLSPAQRDATHENPRDPQPGPQQTQQIDPEQPQNNPGQHRNNPGQHQNNPRQHQVNLFQQPGFDNQQQHVAIPMQPQGHLSDPSQFQNQQGQQGHPGFPVQSLNHPGQQPGYPGEGTELPLAQSGPGVPPTSDENEHDDAEQMDLVFCCWFIWFCLLPLTIWFLPGSFKIIMEYERGIVMRQGRAIKKIKKSGLTFLMPFIDQLLTCDVRTLSRDIPPQEILTSDSTSVMVDAVLYYRIFDPYLALIKAEDVHGSTSLLAQTTIRSFLGSKSLTELLSKRDEMSKDMLEYLDDVTDKWGIKVERLELKDVRLPYHMQRAMAAEAEASREARAKVIQAKGEHLASIKLKEAANIINQSEGAIQLRFLQTMSHVSNLRNHTIVMPLDMDIMKGLQKRVKRLMSKK